MLITDTYFVAFGTQYGEEDTKDMRHEWQKGQ